MVDFKKVKNILYLVAWLFALAAGGLIANVACYGCSNGHYYENQSLDGIIYGMVFITTLLFALLFFEEELPEKMSYLLYCSAAVLYIAAGVLLVFQRDNAGDDKNRTLISGVFACANGAIFLFMFIATLAKKEMLD